MSREENLKELLRYWFEKADEALDAASDEMNAGRLSFSVNRIYYACFYAVSAVLLRKDLRFKKHSGVRAAFHQHLIKSGMIDDKSLLSKIDFQTNPDLGSIFVSIKNKTQTGGMYEQVYQYFQSNVNTFPED